MKKILKDVFFVVKRLIIALGLTLLIYLTKYPIFEIIILANLTNFDVLIGDTLPWILAAITWWYFYRSIKKYFQKSSISEEIKDQS